MENNEINSLIVAFKEYRDLLTPIEQNLRDFSTSFEGMKTDIQNLNSAFGGDIQGKLDKIYRDLSSQAEKSKSLASEIDRFSGSTARYTQQVDRLLELCAGIENRIKTVDEIQKKAEEQIEKLNAIIEEKRKNYDVKQLQKNLEVYNVGVQKISEYINKDVADTLKTSSEKINQIQNKNDSVFEAIVNEKTSIDKLVESYNQSNELLKQVVQKNDVNEEYIFEILDKWAESRRVKTNK
jgi:chromosome segregation ATPase